MMLIRLVIANGLSVLLLTLLPACTGSFMIDEKARKAAKTHTQLGLGRLEQGRLDAAEKELKRALEYNPDSPDAHSTIAIVYDRRGEFDKAEEHYMEAINLKPDDGVVHNNYGAFLCQQKRLKEADGYFLRAINSPRYQTPERALENAGTCANLIPDAEKAEKYLRKALSLNGKLPSALYEMAVITFNQKRYMSTRAYLQRYSGVSRHSPQSLWLGVQAERKLGDFKTAEIYGKQLQKQYPDSIQFKWLLDSGKTVPQSTDLRSEVSSTGATRK